MATARAFGGKEYSPEGIAIALSNFERNLPVAIENGVDLWMRKAHKVSVTVYMEGGGKHAPVNPPPGPLKIRSGDLRRSVSTIPAKAQGNVIIGGLQADTDYAAVHELGGRIPARPYLSPSIDDTEEEGLQIITSVIQQLANEAVG